MDQQFTFTFTGQQTQIIVNGLMELQTKVALPVIQEIEKQAQAQLKAQQAAQSPVPVQDQPAQSTQQVNQTPPADPPGLLNHEQMYAEAQAQAALATKAIQDQLQPSPVPEPTYTQEVTG